MSCSYDNADRQISATHFNGNQISIGNSADLTKYVCDPLGSPWANICHGIAYMYYEAVARFGH